MYQILIVDKNATLTVPNAKGDHLYRAPKIGEHILVKYEDMTKVCEVEDVWTHVNLDNEPAYQGAVQILVRWNKGLDPQLYVRRFKS